MMQLHTAMLAHITITHRGACGRCANQLQSEVTERSASEMQGVDGGGAEQREGGECGVLEARALELVAAAEVERAQRGQAREGSDDIRFGAVLATAEREGGEDGAGEREGGDPPKLC